MLKLPQLFDKYAYIIFMDDILDIYTGSFQNAVRSFLPFGSASSAPIDFLPGNLRASSSALWAISLFGWGEVSPGVPPSKTRPSPKGWLLSCSSNRVGMSW